MKYSEYINHRLYELLEEKFKIITYQSNLLLYILAVSDTLKRIKAYQQYDASLSVQDIAGGIDKDYVSGTRSLCFSSNSSAVDISVLHNKAVGLMDWTSAECSGLYNNSFTLNLQTFYI